MSSILIKNSTLINENTKKVADVLIRKSRIEKISNNISVDYDCKIINGEGL